jgi:quercetin dioxygenase-like cupin family protein
MNATEPSSDKPPITAFRDLAAIRPQRLSPGYLARAVHGGGITFAVVEIDPLAKLPEHSHANEQLGLVLEGSVTFRVGDEQQTVHAGGTWSIRPNTPHFVIAGEAGAVVLDIFTPTRGDWKGLDSLEPATPSWPQPSPRVRDEK